MRQLGESPVHGGDDPSPNSGEDDAHSRCPRCVMSASGHTTTR
jgi:hypothetical protein